MLFKFMETISVGFFIGFIYFLGDILNHTLAVAEREPSRGGGGVKLYGETSGRES
jgi:hypothetical protein